jgi:hypothetical protein
VVAPNALKIRALHFQKVESFFRLKPGRIAYSRKQKTGNFKAKKDFLPGQVPGQNRKKSNEKEDISLSRSIRRRAFHFIAVVNLASPYNLYDKSHYRTFLHH